MATFGSRVALGSRVTVTGKKGVVKFIGTTDFAAGDWIGVELDLDEGKNNGIVNGVQYFDCREGHGLFVKKAQVRIDRSATSSIAASVTPAAKPPSSSAVPTGTGRAASRLQAIREKNKALKEALAVGKTSPQPQRRALGSWSGGSRPVGGDSVHEEPTRPGSPASVVSTGSVGDAGVVTQASESEGNNAQASSARSAPDIRSAAEGRAHKALRDADPTTPALGGARAIRVTETPSSWRQIDPKSAERLISDESSSALPLPPPPSRAINQPSTDAETEALRVRAADATSEAEEAHARLIETTAKLDASETCCRELEGKLSLLRKKSENAFGEERLKASTLAKEKAAAAAAGRREADMECQVSELTDTCEALTLDKEQLALEKEDLQEKMDELQMELDSMRMELEHAQLSAKENEAAARALSAAGGGGGDGSVDVKMLAEQNVKLKDALKRLHSHSIAEKTELTKAIRSLEKGVTASATLKDEVDKLRCWKDIKAAEMEDLMEKLDESKAYEEMVESLTTKNLEIGERCGELEATIADLESSVELSEELETQQAEDIRELQGELTGREVSLHNQKLALESVIKELQDAQQTIERFRKFVDQLKASRDELAAASKTDGSDAALATLEKRSLLTQKASIEKMAAEARRAKISGRLFQVDLLDAQARSSRVSMLLPGSLVLAETELRCIDTDLSACRLIRKAGIALELLELPAIEFMDMFAAAPGKAASVEGGNTQANTALDRSTAIEDCSRLALEAEQSVPIARALGEALAVLGATVSSTSNMSSRVIVTVSAEVASAVVEAEELVDDLLGVIQDEGGLRPAGSATTLSALAVTAKSIGVRRTAAMASGGQTASKNGDMDLKDGGESVGKGICTAVTAVQDCLVCARRAALALTDAALRGAESSSVSSALLSQREDGASVLWQNVRGLWGDMMALRVAVTNGRGCLCGEVEQLALGSKHVLEEIFIFAMDTGKTPRPTTMALANQVASLRVTAKDLLRSPLVSVGVRDGLQILSACPRVIWLAVAPWLAQDADRSPADSNEDGKSIPAPCIARAERVRALLEEAIDLEPALEAAKARAADLTVELVSKSKEFMAATSKREQLETLLEKAEGSQVISTDLQTQVLLLQETSSKFEQENKFMAEALEDLQDSTSRLEAENRSLRMGASPKGRGSVSARSSEQLVQPVGTRSQPTADKQTAREGLATDAMGKGSTVVLQESEESLTSALKWSRAEEARWRGKAFTSVLSGLKPLPHLSPAQGGRPQFLPAAEERAQDNTIKGQDPGDSSYAGNSLNELLSMSKKLAAVRGPPRVVGVQGAALSELSSGAVSRNTCSGAQKIESAEATFFSATAAWQEQQVLNARLENEWREGQERAAKALTCLLGAGSRGSGAFEQEHQVKTGMRVARLRLPSDKHFRPFKAEQAVVPVLLGRSSLERLEQALRVYNTCYA